MPAGPDWSHVFNFFYGYNFFLFSNNLSLLGCNFFQFIDLNGFDLKLLLKLSDSFLSLVNLDNTNLILHFGFFELSGSLAKHTFEKSNQLKEWLRCCIHISSLIKYSIPFFTKRDTPPPFFIGRYLCSGWYPSKLYKASFSSFSQFSDKIPDSSYKDGVSALNSRSCGTWEVFKPQWKSNLP